MIKNILEYGHIPTYVINREVRSDRKCHILNEFKDKPEFNIIITKAVEHEVGAVGLWNSIQKIIRSAQNDNKEFVLVCEDDHYFTNYYSKDFLIKNIIGAQKQGVEILCGGIGGFGTAIPVAKNRYWIDWFWCTQFTLIFKSLYKKIIEYEFQKSDTADGVLSQITPFKMVLYPFISRQKSFGYSDITESNSKNPNMIVEHFNCADNRLHTIHSVSAYYNSFYVNF